MKKFISPLKHNRIILRILVAIFLPDYRKVYQLHIENHVRQQLMRRFLRSITPEEMTRLELTRILLRMDNLQQVVLHLRDKGLTDQAIAHKLNLPIQKIHKLLNRLESEVDDLFQCMNE